MDYPVGCREQGAAGGAEHALLPTQGARRLRIGDERRDDI